MSSCLNRNIVSIVRTSRNLRQILRFSKCTVHSKKFEEKIFHKLPSSSFFQCNNYSLLSDNKYEKVCRETLESLTEFFEELQEAHSEFKNADISYNDGVLTINLGEKIGTYVINRQIPNKQIWLSSPISGPKRYDYVNSCWVYKQNNQSLHSLLQGEISELLNKQINLSECLHYGS